MLEKLGEYAETGIKTVKGMSTMQKAGICAGLAIGIGALFLLASSDEEEVVPATNVDVSDAGTETETVEEVEAEVTPV